MYADSEFKIVDGRHIPVNCLNMLGVVIKILKDVYKQYFAANIDNSRIVYTNE